MVLIIADIIVGLLGLLLAHYLSRPPELRTLRLSQLILVPAGTVIGFNLLVHARDGGGLGTSINTTAYVGVAGFMAVLLAPNIAFLCGQRFCDFLDPMDWTPLLQEIELRPIQRMIDRDQFHDALDELEKLLKTHKPTYEALLLKTKLLYHFGSVDETMSVLLEMIRLSKSVPQQMSVMESIGTLAGKFQPSQKLVAHGRRLINIDHELVLFPTDSDDRSVYRVIAPGAYEVEGMLRADSPWLALSGENWGNATLCWQAVEQMESAKSRKSLLGAIARMHQAISSRLTGRRAGNSR
ncbi:MAG: hypothetical protein JWR26_3359 [Pedosphaera sp.]|nr:hypothetical protein [Pedosphaera sp.]